MYVGTWLFVHPVICCPCIVVYGIYVVTYVCTCKYMNATHNYVRLGPAPPCLKVLICLLNLILEFPALYKALKYFYVIQTACLLTAHKSCT